MLLTVKNFGPIKKATIDLTKRMYVFVGYNNSGKTYMSQLLFALLNPANIEKYVAWPYFDEFDINLVNDTKLEVSEKLVNKIIKSYVLFFKKEITHRTFNITSFSSLIKNVDIQVSDILLKQIQAKTFSSIYVTSDIRTQPITIKFTCKKLTNRFVIDVDFQGANHKTLKELLIKRYLSKFILDLFLSFSQHNIYLPASRVFYPTFYQYIYKAEKEKREKMSKRFEEFVEMLNAEVSDVEKVGNFLKENFGNFKSPYTEPMNVLTESIYNLNQEEKTESNYPILLQQLIEIIGGKINIKKVGGIAPIEFQLELEDKEQLDMYLASSSANQLTTLYLYFKYWAREKHNFLFVDEPEENLHPNNQVKLLNILVQFIQQRQNRLLLVTHTPLFVEAINNLLMLGNIKQTMTKEEFEIYLAEYGIDPVFLNKEEVGIYFFSGDEVHEYDVDNYGTIFKDFEREVAKVKNRSEQLSRTLFKQLNNK